MPTDILDLTKSQMVRPRATGTLHGPPVRVADFKAKLRAFLSEVDGTMTVCDLLDELE